MRGRLTALVGNPPLLEELAQSCPIFVESAQGAKDRMSRPQRLGNVGGEPDAVLVRVEVAVLVRAFLEKPQRHHGVRDRERGDVHARAERHVVAKGAEVRAVRRRALTERCFDLFARYLLKAIWGQAA